MGKHTCWPSNFVKRRLPARTDVESSLPEAYVRIRSPQPGYSSLRLTTCAFSATLKSHERRDKNKVPQPQWPWHFMC